LALLLDGVADRAVHEALGAEVADRLQAEPHLDGQLARRRADALQLLDPGARLLFGAEADLVEELRELALEEVEHLRRFGRARGKLDAGVDVFRVLSEDHHVDILRPGHRRLHALEVADGPETDVQVELLPKRDVERPDAAADRRRQWSLDADEIVAERFERFVGQPVAGLLERLLAGEDLVPDDAARAAVGLLDRRVEHADAGPPDVGAGAVAFDERNDGPVGHDQPAVPPHNRITARSHAAVAHLSGAESRARPFLGHVPDRVATSSQILWKSLWKSGRFRRFLRANPLDPSLCTNLVRPGRTRTAHYTEPPVGGSPGNSTTRRGRHERHGATPGPAVAIGQSSATRRVCPVGACLSITPSRSTASIVTSPMLSPADRMRTMPRASSSTARNAVASSLARIATSAGQATAGSTATAIDIPSPGCVEGSVTNDAASMRGANSKGSRTGVRASVVAAMRSARRS